MALDKILNLFEAPLKIRNVRFYILVHALLSKERQTHLASELSSSASLKSYFRNVDVSYQLNLVKENWTCVKISCHGADRRIKPSDSTEFYARLSEDYLEHAGALFKRETLDWELYDFRVFFRIYPPEKTQEYIPLPPLADISKKIPGHPSEPSTPKNYDEMLEYLRKVSPIDKTTEEMFIRTTEEDNLMIYGSFGIQGSKSTEYAVFPISAKPGWGDREIGDDKDTSSMYKAFKESDPKAKIYGSSLVRKIKGDITYKLYCEMTDDKTRSDTPEYIKLIFPDPTEAQLAPESREGRTAELRIPAFFHM